MRKNSVLITDPIHPEAIKLLKNSGFGVKYICEKSTHQLLATVERYDAIICRTSTKIDREMLDAAKNLKCIGVAATGWDHIDAEEATRRGVVLLGLPPGNKSVNPERQGSFLPTAEHTILCMLAAAGNFYPAVASLKQGKWERYNFVGTELYGKTLGIVGLGRVGGLVAKRAAAFGMNIIGYDPYASDDVAKNSNVKLVTLKRLCQKSDFITVHTHKTSETINLLDKKHFAYMKQGVIVINTARAAVINEQALVSALRSKKVRCAVLDVFENEPHGINMELVKLPNVLATPHIAGVTDEAWRRVSLQTAKDVIGYLKYGRTKNAINKVTLRNKTQN